jgi:23S rRNA C2498 (ribose-2'-O)-methylase RlmM
MTQDSDKTPKKKPTKKMRKKTDENKELEDDEFSRKIKAALQANLDEYAKSRSLSQKQITILNSFIEEHLSCFIMLGYTVDGNPVTLVNANTPKDSDSLSTLLQKFFTKYTDAPPSLGII